MSKKTVGLTIFLIVYSASHLLALNQGDSLRRAAKFKFGVQFSLSVNYFNNGDLSIGEISSDYEWGGAFGFAFDWRLSKINRIKFETVYEYQKIGNSYTDDFNSSAISFKNHMAGFSFFPAIFCIGGKVKPEISAGGYINYIFSYEREATLNSKDFYPAIVPQDLQYGLSFGVGMYLGRQLIELRFNRSLTQFIESESLPNHIEQIKLVFIL